MPTKPNIKELATISFASQKEFQTWLKKNHTSTPGLWMRIFKKDSGEKSITYAEALDVALCYGWIDSQKKSYDAQSYIQKFSPRGLRSIWSKVNIGHINRLDKAQKLQPAGIAQVHAAKKDGRWEQAYDSSKNMKVPDDFLIELKKHKKAYTFFNTLTKANVYAIAWRLQTAKKIETRQKRMVTILDMLKTGKSFH
ncbi:MAG: YdeI/OmpD-associated family protein [Patescibacteria group bacterium]